ncbi:hypothetical protein P7K49_008073 [Saguinus oedipus]|uniref:Uncharacterized protein n=1 Tax=Saguinus oedipus TaxID=9490 RepID=A0ABQ9VWR3_SAGOE|nr:hypothetical protein P7K49_008073 [Saguinus oedipus]
MAYRRPESLYSHDPTPAWQAQWLTAKVVSVIDSWPFVQCIAQNNEERDQVTEPRTLWWNYEQKENKFTKGKNTLSENAFFLKEVINSTITRVQTIPIPELCSRSVTVESLGVFFFFPSGNHQLDKHDAYDTKFPNSLASRLSGMALRIIYSKHKIKVSEDDLEKLILIKWCVLETIRLRAPGVITRKVVEPVEILNQLQTSFMLFISLAVAAAATGTSCLFPVASGNSVTQDLFEVPLPLLTCFVGCNSQQPPSHDHRSTATEEDFAVGRGRAVVILTEGLSLCCP